MAKVNLGKQEEPKVQMAPMIDCMFLLLIFFIIIATIRVKHNEMPLDLLKDGNAVEQKNASEILVLSVFPGRKYAATVVDAKLKPVSEPMGAKGLEDFRKVITAKLAEDPGRTIRIDAHVGVPYRWVAEVIDFLGVQGRKEIGMNAGRAGGLRQPAAAN